MTDHADGSGDGNGDALLRRLSALAHPHRLRLLSVLARESSYVSELARAVGLSRPLAHMHLQKLEEAGLIRGRIEVSDDGKAMRYFDIAPFEITVTPRAVVKAVQSLSDKNTTKGE